MDDWKISNQVEKNGFTLVSLRRYDGTSEGAHRVICGDYMLLVLPDGATSTRSRHEAIWRAIGTEEGSDRLMMWAVVTQLQAIGSHRWVEETSGSVPAAVQDVAVSAGLRLSRLLQMLVTASGPVPGYELAKRCGHRFGSAVFSLRKLGYPIGKKALGNGQYAYFLEKLSTNGQ